MGSIWKDRTFVVLWLACVTLLVGRGYQHIFFEAPYRAFFLKEACFGWAVRGFSDMSWLDFVNSLSVDRSILRFGNGIGLFYLIAALCTVLLGTSHRRIAGYFCYASSVILAFTAFAYYLDKGYQLAQIIEFSAQVATPALLAWYASKRAGTRFHLVIRAVIGLTFLGHGLYAMGLYPVPGHFVHMVISTLGISNAQATSLLLVAGWLDVAVLIGVFIPGIDRYALIYAMIWGFLTACARLTTYVSLDHMFWLSLHQIGYEFLVRIPHFLLPLAALSAGLLGVRREVVAPL